MHERSTYLRLSELLGIVQVPLHYDRHHRQALPLLQLARERKQLVARMGVGLPNLPGFGEDQKLGPPVDRVATL